MTTRKKKARNGSKSAPAKNASVLSFSTPTKDSGLDTVKGLLLSLGGISGIYLLQKAVKQDNGTVNATGLAVSALLHSAAKNKRTKQVAMALSIYFGLKALNNAKVAAVEGLAGVAGMEKVREIIAKVVPTIGNADGGSDDLSMIGAADIEEMLGLDGRKLFGRKNSASAPVVNMAATSLKRKRDLV